VETPGMTERHDVLVIGGGPGGATAALLLARAGWNVAVLERKAFPRRKVCGEYLSGTNLPLFDLLGVGELFRDSAGPEVTRVGLFARDTILESNLPRPEGAGWGRALSREHLDTLLLQRATEAGAILHQPFSATELTSDDDGYHCRARRHGSDQLLDLHARLIVAAHGSWDVGHLPTQPTRPIARTTDLLAFKAHFRNTDLAPGLMPLLAFPGGYGGMVHCDDNRASLSCCIRRDCLAQVRRRHSGEAGAAVLAHIMESCLGIRRALGNAKRDGAWLAAGPIRPGIRLRQRPGAFVVGNAAGEAHPVVAEGISMAMQSAWLLSRHLGTWRSRGSDPADLAPVAASYAQSWRRCFASRLHVAEGLAQWAMRPMAVAGMLPVLRRWPRLLTWGARLSGKATQVIGVPV